MDETPLDQTSEALVSYYERVNEFAKASEPLIVYAVRLRELPEWDAFKQVLMTKIARDSTQMIHGSGPLSERERGKLEGMKFVIDLAETHLPRAIEKKKEFFLKNQGKDNNLTEKQD